MSIIRSARPESHFSIFSNQIIRDTRLSYKARGILLDLLSRPDNWRISAEALASMGKDGRDAIMSGLKELRDYGYIVTERKQDEKGQWTTESIVYDQPKTGFPSSDKPNSDNPVVIEEPIKKNLERIITKPDGLAINDLVALYFDNFPADRMKPSGARVAGNIKEALKQYSPEKLAELIPYIAQDAQSVTSGAINFLQNQLEKKTPTVLATPSRPKFDPKEFENPDAVPMPTYFRDMFKKVSDGDLRPEQD